VHYRAIFRWLLAAFFIAAGLNHFRDAGFYRAMMPAWLPWHEALIQVSGIAEILGGIGVLVPVVRPFAGWCLIALLVAVFPANLNLALHPLALSGLTVPGWALWARLPLQAVLIAWVWWTALVPARDDTLD
jgi:uncharacterized membrane protein